MSNKSATTTTINNNNKSNARIDHRAVIASRNEALASATTSASMPTIQLASGYEMPAVAYGTFRSTPGEETYEAVLTAIREGYRHFDCAHVYGNEADIGRAFAHAFDTGLVQRKDLFVTGKLWNSDHDADVVEKACKHSLNNLELEYFDLYLIHFPICWKHTGLDTPSWGESELGNTPLIDTWRAMEDLVFVENDDNNKTDTTGQRLCRSIGVSNYPLMLLHDLVTQARVPVSCHQIETHVYYTRDSLVNYCLSRNICVTAHTPLGGGKANQEEWTKTPSPLEDPVVRKIAEKSSMTPAQVLLRFLLQRGIVILPKSVRKGRMAENLDVLGRHRSLSPVQMKELAGLDRYKSYKTNPNPINAVLGGPDVVCDQGMDIFD